MNEYICYLSSTVSLNNPQAGIITPFTIEYIPKIQYIEQGYKILKTNENNQNIIKNLGHIDLIRNEIENIDVKEYNERFNSVSLSPALINKLDLIILTIYSENNQNYIATITIEEAKEHSFLKPGVSKVNKSFYYIDNVDKWKLEPLLPELNSFYNEVKIILPSLPIVEPIPKGSDISKYINAADILLKPFAPIFEKYFDLTPKINFIKTY